MAFYSDRVNFRGKINGKTANNMKNVDFNINEYENRLKVIEKIIEECDELINEYISKYYKYNTTNELSDDINIFKNIEFLATYLLNSKNLDVESKQEYKIFTDEQLFSKYYKENKEDYNNIIPFLKVNKKNDYIIQPDKITKEDFNDDRINKYLEDYELMLNYIRKQLLLARNGEKIEIKNIKLAKKIAKEIKDDMILIKEKIIRPIRLNISTTSCNNICLDEFDYTNEKHIREALYLNMTNIIPDNELSLIKYDLDLAIKKIYKNKKIDEKDIYIINCIRKNKSYTFEDIGYELGITKQAVNGRLTRISKKIAKYFEKSIDNWFTNM